MGREVGPDLEKAVDGELKRVGKELGGSVGRRRVMDVIEGEVDAGGELGHHLEACSEEAWHNVTVLRFLVKQTHTINFNSLLTK